MSITIILIALTCLISFIAFSQPSVSSRLAFVPYMMHRNKSELFRFISMGFVHANGAHLLGNMVTLFFFGREIETIFGPLQFIILYLGGLVCSAAPIYQKQKDNPAYSAVGASGAVSAVLFSIVLFAPWSIIFLKLFIPLPFIVYAVGYLIYSGYMSRRGDDHIAHDAHLWGALYGIAFTLFTHPAVVSSFLNQLLHPHFG